MLIFYKQIDKSALNEGISIPAAYQKILMQGLGLELPHGQNQAIKIELDGVLYDAVLKNQKYDRNRYQGHTDIVQIRYNPGSAIARRIREKFSYTANIIKEQTEATGSSRVSLLSEQDKEFIAVYSTDQVYITVALAEKKKRIKCKIDILAILEILGNSDYYEFCGSLV